LIKEAGRVLRIDEGSLWVATLTQSSCQSCQAKAGCGQQLLMQLGAGESLLRVPLGQFDVASINIGDPVQIGIAETAVVKGSLIAYSLPLLGILLGSAGAAAISGSVADGPAIAGAVIGFAMASVLVYWHGLRSADDARYQPILLQAEGVQRVLL